jgi:hypothetical protein
LQSLKNTWRVLLPLMPILCSSGFSVMPPKPFSTMKALRFSSSCPVGVDLGEHGEQVGESAVGDPHLLAVQHVVLAVGVGTALVLPLLASLPLPGSVRQ